MANNSIRTVNRELEKRVQERTRELEEAQRLLREQAIHDALTGLFNRYHLNDVLSHEFARAKRKQHPIAFLLIDLDRFKAINDQYGHNAGDCVLKETARIIQQQIRASDSAFRYGGEFLLVVPEITPDIARARAEQL